MPRSLGLILAGIAIAGVIAAVVAYVLTPETPTPTELADEARRLSDEAGFDRAETEQLLAGCAGILEDYSSIWQGMTAVRYEACLREAGLLE
jgi:uncharacterized membrane protein